LGIGSVGVPIAAPYKGVTIGIDPKVVYSGYAQANGYADINGSSYQDTLDYKFNKEAADLDIGASYPVRVKNVPLTTALVVRHLFEPSFDYGNGNNLQLSPEVDAGALAKYKDITEIAEVHDLTNANGAGTTLHVGLEKVFLRTIALRTGFDNGSFVYGGGLLLGPLHIDAAAGTDWQHDASVGISYRIGFK
jgi:hypothetical protein